MAMWEATQEHETSFTEEFGRDLLVLAAGMGVAATLGAVAVWVVEPVGLLTGWNRSAALWSLVPALALLAAHWQVAKAWTGGSRVPGVDSRATILAALMLAPAVLLLSGASSRLSSVSWVGRGTPTSWPTTSRRARTSCAPGWAS